MNTLLLDTYDIDIGKTTISIYKRYNLILFKIHKLERIRTGSGKVFFSWEITIN